MQIINELEMWKAVTLTEVMDAIEDAYEIHRTGKYLMPDRFFAAKDKNLMIYMPCFLERFIGTKMLAEFPDNPRLGIPYLNGLMILNDTETGLPKAVMNGSTLTAIRTGAVGGVALRHLAPEDSRTAGLVGCGVQGLHQLLFACAVRPITDVYLYDGFVKDLKPFTERLTGKLEANGISSVRIHTCADVTELVQNSQLLLSATQTTDPVYPDEEELLRGKTFVAIGSWRPERRELPDAVWKLVNHAYTELPYACEETGDLRIPLENGVLTKERVRYLEDLIHDAKEGRAAELGETRCFKSVGMGIFDARVAQLIYENALEKGAGQAVEW